LPAAFATDCGRSPNAGRVAPAAGSSELELEQAMPTNESKETMEQKLRRMAKHPVLKSRDRLETFPTLSKLRPNNERHQHAEGAQ
jgi:hypothetical protein